MLMESTRNVVTAANLGAPIASLEEVLAYQNMDVVEKFMESWDLSLEEAVDLFEEMKRWLWLCAEGIAREAMGEPRVWLGITFSMTLLDEMWHAFILFTMPYQAFCKQYFGFYLNHGPTTGAEKRKAEAEFAHDPEAFQAKIEQDLETQYSYIYDRLGPEILQKWYSEWTDKITPEYLSQVHKQPWLQGEH
jgi:hypothetical protein